MRTTWMTLASKQTTVRTKRSSFSSAAQTDCPSMKLQKFLRSAEFLHTEQLSDGTFTRFGLEGEF